MNTKFFLEITRLLKLPGVPQDREGLFSFLAETGYGKGRPEIVSVLIKALRGLQFLKDVSDTDAFTLACCLVSHLDQGFASVPGEEMNWGGFADAVESRVRNDLGIDPARTIPQPLSEL